MNTLQMPWDNLMNFSYYKISYVRIIKYKIKKDYYKGE